MTVEQLDRQQILARYGARIENRLRRINRCGDMTPEQLQTQQEAIIGQLLAAHDPQRVEEYAKNLPPDMQPRAQELMIQGILSPMETTGDTPCPNVGAGWTQQILPLVILLVLGLLMFSGGEDDEDIGFRRWRS